MTNPDPSPLVFPLSRRQPDELTEFHAPGYADLLAVAKSVIQLERSTVDRGLLDIKAGDLAALYLAARRAVEKATGMPQG
jgi:hypothetical protein